MDKLVVENKNDEEDNASVNSENSLMSNSEAQEYPLQEWQPECTNMPD